MVFKVITILLFNKAQTKIIIKNEIISGPKAFSGMRWLIYESRKASLKQTESNFSWQSLPPFDLFKAISSFIAFPVFFVRQFQDAALFFQRGLLGIHRLLIFSFSGSTSGHREGTREKAGDLVCQERLNVIPPPPPLLVM